MRTSVARLGRRTAAALVAALTLGPVLAAAPAAANEFKDENGCYTTEWYTFGATRVAAGSRATITGKLQYTGHESGLPHQDVTVTVTSGSTVATTQRVTDGYADVEVPLTVRGTTTVTFSFAGKVFSEYHCVSAAEATYVVNAVTGVEVTNRIQAPRRVVAYATVTVPTGAKAVTAARLQRKTSSGWVTVGRASVTRGKTTIAAAAPRGRHMYRVAAGGAFSSGFPATT